MYKRQVLGASIGALRAVFPARGRAAFVPDLVWMGAVPVSYTHLDVYKRQAQDILDCYAEARKAGHDDINMDLIAGLPGDTVESFERSLRQAIALDPENITVHTLTLKPVSYTHLDVYKRQKLPCWWTA